MIKNILRNVSFLRILRIVIPLALISGFVLFGTNLFQQPGPCDGKQWDDPNEYLECKFPNPPIGRWHAVYAEDFAKNHNLPPENISTDLSPGVDYMEMDVQPYAEDGVACIVNMLIKKPHDVALYNGGRIYKWGPEFHARRELAHIIDLNAHKGKLKDIVTFGLAPRNNEYDPSKSYSIGNSWAYHAEDVLPGYDYVTANAGCYWLLSDETRFPDGWSFNYAKASKWGRYEARHKSMDDPNYPQGKEFYDSRISINIPTEIISSVFADMPIGGY